MTDDTDPTHERAVEDFMGAARVDDPAHVAEVEAKYPVLDQNELAWRRSREVRLSEKFENTLSLSADIFGRRIAAPLTFRRSPARRFLVLGPIAVRV